MRILQLIDSFDQGGSERQALELTRLLHESGKFEVRVASLKPGGVLRWDFENLSLGEMPSYPLKSFYDLNAFRQLRQFVHHLRVSQIDLLHTHDFYTNIFGMTAGLLAGVKVRIASRRETSGMRSRGQQLAQQLAYNFAHQIIANSESVKQKLVEEGVIEERITVVHNGLRFARVSAPVNEAKAAAFRELIGVEFAESQNPPAQFVTIVANMRHDVKDYPMFLRMAQRVGRAVPAAGFLLAGEGELQESLQRMAADFGIGDRTFFLGRCENIGQLLSVSDVGVLSSKAEGFSNSILEYMAAGLPVVATDVGGAKEAIVEGETGHTVPSGNDRAMANLVVSLLRDPAKAKLMGAQGRRVVEEKFSERVLLEKTEALYAELLAKHVGSGPASRLDPFERVSVNQPAGASPPSLP